MKKTLMVLTLLLFPGVACAEDDPTAPIRADFDEATEAVLVGDAEGILKYTYPGLIEKVGGLDAMRSIVVGNLTDLERRGMSILTTEIVSIAEPLPAGRELHSVVRAKRTVKTPGGRQIQDTFMIAVSIDGGKRWTFVDGPQLTPQHIDALFPEFNEALELPETAPPVVEKDAD